MDIGTRDEFLQHLRDALMHLHNADRLRGSPLAELLGVAGRFDSAAALRRMLTEAIASLEPSSTDLAQAHAWRIYDSLFCCYVQQLSQRVVSDQLGISERQLRRELHAAIEVLADHLWAQYHLAERLQATGKLPATRLLESSGAAGEPVMTDELAWLQEVRSGRSTDLHRELDNALALVRPLAAQHGIKIRTTIDEAGALYSLAAHPVAVTQILLNLLTLAISAAPPGSSVSVTTRPRKYEAAIEIRGPRMSAPPAWHQDDSAGLDMARRLAEICGGTLVCSEDTESFAATASLPVMEQLPVLLIDDNADTFQLLQRYTSATRYRLIGASDPGEALELAQKLMPRLIVLDVMMPQIDGWRVLGQLRNHPMTSEIPVIVCTILAQEALALSLGASGYIRKPVTREVFLAALDRQIDGTAPAHPSQP